MNSNYLRRKILSFRLKVALYGRGRIILNHAQSVVFWVKCSFNISALSATGVFNAGERGLFFYVGLFRCCCCCCCLFMFVWRSQPVCSGHTYWVCTQKLHLMVFRDNMEYPESNPGEPCAKQQTPYLLYYCFSPSAGECDQLDQLFFVVILLNSSNYVVNSLGIGILVKSKFFCSLTCKRSDPLERVKGTSCSKVNSTVCDEASGEFQGWTGWDALHNVDAGASSVWPAGGCRVSWALTDHFFSGEGFPAA